MSSDPPNPFLVRLRRADEALAAARPSPRLDRRVEESLARARASRTPSPRVLRRGLVGAAGAAAAALLFLVGDVTPTHPRVTSPEVSIELPDGGVIRLEEEGVTLASIYPGRLFRGSEGLRVEAGMVRFVVSSRPHGPPLRVHAGPMQIEVIGTVFTVDVRPEGGHVWLAEGRIDLIDGQGRRERLSAGAVRGWGDARERWPETTTELEIGQIMTLEQSGRLDEARARLARILRRPIDQPAAEAASFELGLLTVEAEAKCLQWRRHQLRFPQGNYAEPVEEALVRCSEGNSQRSRE
ncbi:MAG: FecR family protein [Myxococcota bacterium]